MIETRETRAVALLLLFAVLGITYEPLPPDDHKVRRPDITKAKTLLDWTPTVGLREGLERSLEYFESRV